jgi:glycosyltransferase involved in cell wall biosynthesis
VSAVDVVVPCYNYGRYLKSCVDSVLSQRDVDVRILIIDDASSDDTAAAAEQLASNEPRITFRRHAENLGHIKTFNEGILHWARAPYTLLISADDMLTAGALARATNVLDAHPEAGMVYGISKIIADGETPSDAFDAVTPTYQIVSGPRFLKFCCEFGNPAASPTAVVRTELQQSTGGYCAKMLHTSDMEMWMRLATRNAIAVIKETQAYYRMHGSNMALQYSSGWLRDLRERTLTCEYVYSEWGGEQISGFDSWIVQMKRSFAERALRSASHIVDCGDWDSYRDCLAFATQMNPHWRRSAASWRLRVKRLLGTTLWHGLRKSASRFLGVGGDPTTIDHVSDWRHGGRFGWWPEAGTSDDI